MKKLALVLIMMLPVFCWSQSTSKLATETSIPTNWERLNVDYEIKNNPNPDPGLISLLNLTEYEVQRRDYEDVELFNSATHYTVILYSKSKTTSRKQGENPDSDHQIIYQNK